MFPLSCKLFEASGQHPTPFHQATGIKHVYQACIASLSVEHVHPACVDNIISSVIVWQLWQDMLCPHLVTSLYILISSHNLHMSCHRHVICCGVTLLIIAVSQHLHLPCRCTLIDRRPQKLSKSQRKWLQHFKQQPCVAAGTEVNSDTAPVNCSDAETPAAGQGNISPASVCSSPGESATEDPPNHAADQRHLPSYASALPPIHPPASDDNVTAGDAGAHATCSDLQDQAIKHTPVDICSAQPASIEAALTDPQPHPANPQPATADAVMSFSRSGSAAAEVASLTHGPHGDEGHTSAHGGGVQNSSEDLRGSLSQQIQVTAGYQSVHHCKLKSQRS